MSQLVEIIKIIPSIQLDLRYSTTDNITKRVLYPNAKAYIIPDAAASLNNIQQLLVGYGLGLVIWDAYRPLSVSRELWLATPKSQKKFVANPDTGSMHNRGCAIDVTLIDTVSEKQIEMPSGFDDFSERAAPTFIDTDSKRTFYRNLLKSLMEANGFNVNKYEWWHYDWKNWADYPVLDIPIDKL